MATKRDLLSRLRKVVRKEPRSFQDRILYAHLKQLQSLIEKRGARGVRALYETARTDLQARLRSTGVGSDKVGSITLRAMLDQTEAVLALLSDNLTVHLDSMTDMTTTLGGRQAVAEYKRLSEHFTGTTPMLDVERGAIFQGLVSDVQSSLLRRHKRQAKGWALSSINAIEQELSNGAMTGKPLDALVQDVMKASGIMEQQKWRAERIVRTEMAYGHGAAKFQALKEQKKQNPKLQKRLIATFDDRTGEDSYLQHGQTVPVDKPFTWKHKVNGAWVVTPYMHPPNRPNDREVVIPWDPEWDETSQEAPLSRAELAAAGVDVPAGHRPGKPYR